MRVCRGGGALELLGRGAASTRTDDRVPVVLTPHGTRRSDDDGDHQRDRVDVPVTRLVGSRGPAHPGVPRCPSSRPRGEAGLRRARYHRNQQRWIGCGQPQVHARRRPTQRRRLGSGGAAVCPATDSPVPSVPDCRGVSRGLRSVAMSAEDTPISVVSIPGVWRLVQGGVLPPRCRRNLAGRPTIESGSACAYRGTALSSVRAFREGPARVDADGSTAPSPRGR